MTELIATKLNPQSEDFKKNSAHHRALEAQLDEAVAKAAEGGGEKYRTRHELYEGTWLPGAPFSRRTPDQG